MVDIQTISSLHNIDVTLTGFSASNKTLLYANHIEMVLVNLGDEIIKKDRIRFKFTAELSYCTEVAQQVKTFLEGEAAKDTLLGIGVAIPGIIDQKGLATG